MSSPIKHLIVGTVLGAGIYAASHSLIASAGLFFGSWLIQDLDHVWAYWKAIKFTPLKMINIKEFFKWNDMMSKRFLDQPYLCWLPLHTIEFLGFWFVLTYFLSEMQFFAIGWFCFFAFIAMLIHFTMDRVELRLKTPFAGRYCHSAIEYWWRKNWGEEATYEDMWGVKVD